MNSSSDYAHGGAIYINSGSPAFTDCEINYNTVNATQFYSYGVGGAVATNYRNHITYDEPVKFTRCQFIGNTISSYYRSLGGALDIRVISQLSGCLISGNTISSSARETKGGGVYINLSSYYNSSTGNYETGEVSIVNSTIVNNSASATSSSYTATGGGIFIESSEDVVMFNSIVWGNTAESSDNIYVSGSSLTSNYNNVEGGTGQSWFGNNSLNIDPRFTDALSLIHISEPTRPY